LIVRQPFSGLKKVLLTSDGSSTSHFTYDYLGDFPLPPIINLEVMHVIPPVQTTYLVEPAGAMLPLMTPDNEASLKLENEIRGNEILETACYELSLHGLNAKKVLTTGDCVNQILSYIKTNQIDLLVCGSRGVGNLTGWLLGSVSRELVLHSPCSIMIARSPE
jgi:nucleotide-binding universal stress UspA family protein